MKTKHKKRIAALIVIVSVIALLFFSPRLTKAYSKHTTFRYVENNCTELVGIAEDVISRKVTTPYDYDNYTVNYFSSAKKPVVEFNGYGFGLAPSGFYSGFYYSPEDIPVRFNGSSTAMESYKKGWIYTEKGDNHGYTEKICDNWYWFEFYF